MVRATDFFGFRVKSEIKQVWRAVQRENTAAALSRNMRTGWPSASRSRRCAVFL